LQIFDDLRADLHYAFRTLRNHLGFSAIAVLSLALGIGVNLACFMSLYAVVLHPFSYADLDRIMTVSETPAKSPSERDPVAAADYLDWQQDNRSFESMGAYRLWDVNLTGVNHPDHIRGALATAEFFQILGMAPARGRTFTPAECEQGKDAVAVVSHAFWQTRMASRFAAIGEMVSLGGRKFTVIGVMPDEFNLPLAVELWVPLSLTPEQRKQRTAQPLMVLGKLRPGVSQIQAGMEMDAIGRRLEQRYPLTNEDRRVLVASLRDVMKTPGDRFVLVLAVGALFVLLLACTNVGSLQVARIMSREKEIGLRSALGASQFRILRQLFTESLVLGVAGGAVGLALAYWNLTFTRSSIPIMVYRYVAGLRDMKIDWQLITIALLLSLAASVLCCVPAIVQVVRQATAGDINEVLKEGGRSASSSPSRSRLRTTLVIAEVALAFVLLVGAALMVGTFQRLLTVNLGFDPTHVLTGEIALSGSEYHKAARIDQFYGTLLRNLSGVPDVRTVAAEGNLGQAQVMIVWERIKPAPGELRPHIHSVTPQYLQTLRIPLLKGRWISEQDGPEAPPAVVLSSSVARHYWPGSNPIGQRIRFGNSDSRWLTVAGVTGDVNDWFFGNPMPAAYVSFRQFPQG
jgi:putative ABC transport system permease protein